MELGSRTFFLCPKRAKAAPKSCSAAVTMAHYQALLEAMTGSVVQRLREKETNVQKAVRCNNELEAREMQWNSEVQAWQERAQKQKPRYLVFKSICDGLLLRSALGEGEKRRWARNSRCRVGFFCGSCKRNRASVGLFAAEVERENSKNVAFCDGLLLQFAMGKGEKLRLSRGFLLWELQKKSR
ncbi:E3 ubiquitin-protein ligase BOI-like [Abeliophyllum distichum]|uniref:E3 ubiquitin-protein ligase BOI-like n=1 Tax=Abeliophyllum distichum TaxID=126358 RepID=A0ABD1VVT9_9LAMI